MKSKLKVNDIQVELYPCSPNRYKWQLKGLGDIEMMRRLCEDFSDVRHLVVEIANPGDYEFWINKKEFIQKQRGK